jgi:hypothetical protein
MDIVASLNNRKVRLKEIHKWEVYLRKQWENNFAGHLTADDKKAIYLSSGYLWHLFSYNKRECLVGGEPADGSIRTFRHMYKIRVL